MKLHVAAKMLSALALEDRLEIFRLLIRNEPAGLKAGEVQAALRCPASTLSANLKILTAAELVERRQQGQFVIYRARHRRMRDLMAYLLEDCCNASPEICGALLAPLERASAPFPKAAR